MNVEGISGTAGISLTFAATTVDRVKVDPLESDGVAQKTPGVSEQACFTHAI